MKTKIRRISRNYLTMGAMSVFAINLCHGEDYYIGSDSASQGGTNGGTPVAS